MKTNNTDAADEFVPPVIKYILMMFRIIIIPEKKKCVV